MDTLFLIATAIFLLAGTVKGLVGIGLPTAVVGLLSQFVDPRQAIALLLLPMLISNAWQAHQSGMIADTWRKYWPIATTMVLGIFIFAQFAAYASQQLLTIAVGVVIIAFVLFSAFTRPINIPDRFDRSYQVGFGLVAGVLGGLTSIWVAPLVIYLVSKGIQKDAFVGIIGFLLCAGSLPLLIGYWQTGLATSTLLLQSAFMIVPTFLGMKAGGLLRARMNGDQFKNLLLGIFFLLGANLIRTAVF